MIIPTHILLGNSIFEHLQEKMPLPMNKWFFTFGNIKPDLPWNFPDMSHYQAHNFEQVLQMIEKTISYGLSDTPASIQSFSINAGIICHFICDYFCTPHSNIAYYKNKLAEHLLYEKELQQFAKSIPGKNALQSDFSWDFSAYPSVKEGIEYLHQLYSSEKSSFKNDLRFAFVASVAISEYMMQEAYAQVPASPCFVAI